MIDERQEELASLYALDLLEGAEQADFERALATDPELQGLVRALRETSAALAHTAPAAPAPAALKARVLASIGGQSSAADRVVRPNPALFRVLLPWAIAACLAIVAARFWMLNSIESEMWRAQVRTVEIELQSTQQQLEAERLLARAQLAQLDLANYKIAALASLMKNSPEAVAVAVWNPLRQEGMFALEKMPPLTADQRLELWVIEDKPEAKPVSAGVFEPRGDVTRIRFKPTAAVGALKMFAVSREKNDGQPFHAQPSEVVMVGASR